MDRTGEAGPNFSRADAQAPLDPAAEDRPEDKVSLYIKATWGVGGLGAQLLINAVGGLALFYLTTIVGISALVAGNLMMISKIYDAVSDPVAGAMSDRSRSPKGRRRPYLFWGAWISTISMLMVFFVPFHGDSIWSWAYVLTALILCTTGYSVFNVPYMAMPGEMTSGYHERSAIHSWRVFFALVGTMLASSGAGILLAALGEPGPGAVSGHGPRTINDQGDYFILSLIFAALILATMLTSWWGTRKAPMVARTETSMPLVKQWLSILQNKPFLVVIVAKAIQLLGVAASGAALFFLVVMVLQRSPAALAYIGIPFIITGMVATPLLFKLSKLIGKKPAFVLSVLTAASGALSWTLAQPGDPVWTLALRGMAAGVGFSGSIMFAMSMLTDAIEVDAVKTGLRREGTYMSLYSFAEKFAAAFGPAIVGAALTFAGFDRTASITLENAEAVRQATLLGASYIPAFCATTAGMLLVFFYKIDRVALSQSRKFERKAAK